MKTLLKLLFFVACLGLVISCSEPDEVFNQMSDAELKSAKLKVYPSTDPDVLTKANEDWTNINEALQNAGPGEVVQLGEGLFYLHKSIVRWDFNGTLKGAGRDKTTIQTMPGEPFDVSACPDVVFSWSTTQGSSMLCFPHNTNSEERTVEVSGLTIVANETSTEWKPDIDKDDFKNNLIAVRVYYSNILGTGGYWGDQSLSDKIDLNVMFKNLSVLGEEDVKYSDGFSLMAGFSAIGASNGSVETKNIIMKNAYIGMAYAAFCGENSIITIKNSRLERMIMGVYTWLNSGWVIQNNKFKDCSSRGVSMNSYNSNYDLPATSAVILNNSFTMDNIDATAFIGVRLDNVKFHDNYFEGNCKDGVKLVRGSYWDIKNNNFCNLNVSNSEAATIILNKTTNNIVKNNANQVVGGSSASDPTNIIGEGRECDD